MWNKIEMAQLQIEAAKIQKELQNTEVESEFAWMIVTVNGNMRVVSVDFEKLDLIPWLNEKQKKALGIAFEKAVNKWLNKVQETAETRMRPVIEQLNNLS